MSWSEQPIGPNSIPWNSDTLVTLIPCSTVLLSLLSDLLRSSCTTQQQMIQCQGFLVISHILEKVRPPAPVCVNYHDKLLCGVTLQFFSKTSFDDTHALEIGNSHGGIWKDIDSMKL